MSKALITESYLTDIADAIRAKNGSSDTYTPPQMAAAIAAIPTGGGGDGGLMIDCIQYQGSSGGDSTSSLSCTVTGRAGETALLAVMHRVAITSITNDPELVYNSGDTGGWQFVSIYKWTMAANSETVVITTASSGRICAVSMTVAELNSLSEPTMYHLRSETGTKYFDIANNTGKYKLFVVSDGYGGNWNLYNTGQNVKGVLGQLAKERLVAGFILSPNTVTFNNTNSVNGTDDYNNCKAFVFDVN